MMCGYWLAMVTIEPLWEGSGLCVDVIYHVQKSSKIISYIIFHLLECWNVRECRRVQRELRVTMSRPFFDIIAQIIFCGWEFLYC